MNVTSSANPGRHRNPTAASGDDAAEDALGEFTGGDTDAAALLRENLTGLAREHRGTPVGRLLDDVLDGRRPVQELRDSDEFMDVARSGVDQYRTYLSSLSDVQRADLTRDVERVARGRGQ